MEKIFIMVIGLSIGSFLNVCIYRLPHNRSIVDPPSHCEHCGARLKAVDLIPLFSYLWLHGRCRYCKAKITARYLCIEILTAALFIWCYQIFDGFFFSLKAFLFIAFLIVITFIDIDHQLILDKVLIWLAGTGVVINLWIGTVGIADILIAVLFGGGVMLLIAVASQGGMGDGDIKFAAALGLWLGWKLTLLALFLAFIFGGVVGIIVLLLKKKGRKDFIPFGPFLALGAFISMLYGNSIIVWYLSTFM